MQAIFGVRSSNPLVWGVNICKRMIARGRLEVECGQSYTILHQFFLLSHIVLALLFADRDMGQGCG